MYNITGTTTNATQTKIYEVPIVHQCFCINSLWIDFILMLWIHNRREKSVKNYYSSPASSIFLID